VYQLPVRSFTGNPEIAAQLPKSRTDQYELLFGNNQSLYQQLPSATGEDQQTFSSGGNVVAFRMAGGNDVVYHNFEKAYRLDQREVMDRNFLVSDSIRMGNWKLTNETKTVLNYVVRKAIGQRISPRSRMSMENGEMKRTNYTDTSTVIAWFTTDIPVAIGPEMQGQLPGAILEMDINKGETTYRAIEVSPKVNLSKLKEPKEGKKMTQTEYLAERDKLIDEMRRNRPGGGTIRINQ
jgi:GLPGLI family protein